MDNSTNIQLYRNAKDNKGAAKALFSIIETIAGRTGESAVLQQQIEKLRELKVFIQNSEIKLQTTEKENTGFAEYVKGFKKQYDDLKKQLPAATFAGTFAPTRSEKNIQAYTGIITVDIDKLQPEQLTALFNKLQQDAFTFVLFISPSGTGIKILVLTNATPATHKEHFTKLESYYLGVYGITIDTSGKDVSRLCFLSYDENLYINKGCKIFNGEGEYITHLPKQSNTELSTEIKKELSAVTPKEKKQLQAGTQTVNDVFESTQQVRQYTEAVEGMHKTTGRNAFVFKFSCNCSRVGIAEIEALNFALGFATDLNPTEVKATVASAYKTTTNEFAKFKRNDNKSQSASKSTRLNVDKSNSNNLHKAQSPASVQTQSSNADSTEPDYIFWKEHITEKGKDENKYTVTRLELSRVDFCDFLYSKGFHLLNTGEEGNYQVVHSNDGIIKPVTPQQIKHFAINWCRSFFLKSVEEMLRKGQKNYFALNELDSLPYKEIELKRDTKEESFFFFQNCYVCVNNTGDITTHQYTQLQQYIWESKKIKFDFKPVKLNLYQTHKEAGKEDINYPLPAKKMDCEFARFVSYVSWNPLNDEEKYFTPQLINQRFECMCTAFGYMLDAYKHPALRKGVFAVDHKIGEKGEQNGRTGKSLFPKAWSLLRKVATINGKGFDPRYNFRYEPITIDSEVVNFNDMERGFDPECLFEVIADDYSVNRRNTGYIHMKYVNSPKVYVSSNHVPKGDGSSYSGRMHIIEFSDYFNDRHSPYDEFGHGLFEDWSDDEKQRFFNFALLCVSMYKTGGLVDYPNPNYESRKLVSEVVQEFIDFMDNLDYVPRNKPFVKIDVLATYNDKIHCPLGYKRLMPHTFSKWVKQYCKNKGYKFNPKQNGAYDKRNNIEYYTIADKNFKAE